MEYLATDTLSGSSLLLSLREHVVFRVQGTDATRYLHGRLTQDIKGLSPDEGKEALMLNPQGRILGKMIVVRTPIGFLLVSDPLLCAEEVSRFEATLLEFKVSDDVTLDRTGFHALWLIGRAPEIFNETESIVTVPLPFGTLAGHLLIGEPEELAELALRAEKSHIPLVHEEVFHRLRIEQKLPIYPVDLGKKVLAPDINLSRYVSFTKGCYVGQEVVEMATARGRPQRRFEAFRAAGEVRSGVEIFRKEESGTTNGVCGFITSAVFIAEKEESLLLGFVKSDVAVGERVSAGSTDLVWR